MDYQSSECFLCRLNDHIGYIPIHNLEFCYLLCEMQYLNNIEPQFQEISYDTFSKTIDEIASQIKASRSLILCIENRSKYSLLKPELFIERGEVPQIVQSVIKPKKAVVHVFQNRPYSFHGTNGIITYFISSTKCRLCILWKIPYKSFLYSNLFAVQIIGDDSSVDEQLFNQLTEFCAKCRIDKFISYGNWCFKVNGHMEPRRNSMFLHIQFSDG